MMEDDYDFIESQLNNCLKLIHKDSIYYVIINKNINRQLKYNKILTKKNIVIDLTKITSNDILLYQNIKCKSFNLSPELFKYFVEKYKIKYSSFYDCYIYVINLITDILNKLLNFKGYRFINSSIYLKSTLSEEFNVDKYIIIR